MLAEALADLTGTDGSGALEVYGALHLAVAANLLGALH